MEFLVSNFCALSRLLLPLHIMRFLARFREARYSWVKSANASELDVFFHLLHGVTTHTQPLPPFHRLCRLPFFVSTRDILGTYSWNHFQVNPIFFHTLSLLWLALHFSPRGGVIRVVSSGLRRPARGGGRELTVLTGRRWRREISELVLHQQSDPLPGWAGDTPAEDEAVGDCINLH